MPTSYRILYRHELPVASCLWNLYQNKPSLQLFVGDFRPTSSLASNRHIINDYDTASHIVIVNSRFLQRPQNQLIHGRLSKTKLKLIGSGSDPERLAGRQTDSQTAMVDGVWSWDGEGGREKRINQAKICWRAMFSFWSERAVER